MTEANEHIWDGFLKPLYWYEKWKDGKVGGLKGVHAPPPKKYEEDPLLKKKGRPKGIMERTITFFSRYEETPMMLKDALVDSVIFVKGWILKVKIKRMKPRDLHNPISFDRLRMGIIVYVDVGSEQMQSEASTIVDKIFDRLDFDASEANAKCPIVVLVVGGKCDLRGSKRKVGAFEEVQHEIEGSYENADTHVKNVFYMECSSATGVGVEAIMQKAMLRLKLLPTIADITAAKVRRAGILGWVYKWLLWLLPWLDDVVRSLKKFWKKTVLKFLKKYTPIPWLKKQGNKILKTTMLCTKLRWLPKWCPSFIQKLRVEKTEEEEELERQEESQIAEGGELEEEGEEDDDDM